MPYKKISPIRLRDIPGPRRAKPKVRRQNQELQAAIAREKDVLDALVRDTEIRRAFMRGADLPWEPLAVWTEFDQTSLLTELAPYHLEKWETLTEWMKTHLGFQVALEYGCYSFTANLHPDLEKKWVSEGKGIAGLIQKRIRQELEADGMRNLPYFYVIEARSKSTKSRCKLHIHGYLASMDPLVATKFKLALERALCRNELRRIERKQGVDVEPGYDLTDGPLGPGRWVSYITKNVHRYDKRIKGRRIFMSTSLTQIARSFWALLREEPLAEA